MINATMKTYDYFTFGADNDYAQPQLSEQPTGKIKIAINVTSQSVIDNIRFKDATYLGLTHAAIDDSFVIQYGDEKLKVLYVNPLGRIKQVYLKNYD